MRPGLEGVIRLGALLATVMAGSAEAQPTAAAVDPDVIYFEYGVGAVRVGVDSASRREIRQKLYLLVYGPESVKAPRSIAKRVPTCVRSAMPGLARRLNGRVDSTGAQWADPDAPEGKLNAAARALDDTLRTLDADLAVHLRSCTKDGNSTLPRFHLGFSLRACIVGDGPRECARPERASAGSIGATRFATVLEWLDAQSPADTASRLRSGRAILLDPKRDAMGRKQLGIAEVAPDAHDAALERKFRDPRFRQRIFEEAVLESRAKNERLAASALAALDMPREIAVATADVLDDMRPVFARLRSDAQVRLAFASDEIARTRIRECRDYAGHQMVDSVAKCAGLTLTASVLAACLSGGRCDPMRSGSVEQQMAEVRSASLAFRLSAQALATGTLIPRALDAQRTVDQMTAVAENCVRAAKGDAKGAVACFGRSQMVGEAERLQRCMRGKDARSTDAVLGCAASASGRPIGEQARATAQCLDRTRGNADARALCVLESAVPAKVRATVVCASKATSAADVGECLGTREVAKVRALEACVGSDPSKVWEACAAFLPSDLPPEVRLAAKCLANGQDLAGAALCAAQSQLPPEVQKTLQCAIQSGGDPAGAGVCLIADGLNKYQLAAVQCAVASGGEPTSFATCSGGRLLVMRIEGCSRDEFGKGACFGPNNDFQKAITAIFGKPIKPNSPIGTVLNFHISTAKATLALAEKTGKDLEKGAKELGKDLERDAKGAGRALDRLSRTIFPPSVRKPFGKRGVLRKLRCC